MGGGGGVPKFRSGILILDVVVNRSKNITFRSLVWLLELSNILLAHDLYTMNFLDAEKYIYIFVELGVVGVSFGEYYSVGLRT